MIREDSINKLTHSIKGSQNISVNMYFISHQLSEAKINRISFAERKTEARSPLTKVRTPQVSVSCSNFWLSFLLVTNQLHMYYRR